MIYFLFSKFCSGFKSKCSRRIQIIEYKLVYKVQIFWNDLVIYDPCHIFSVSVTQKNQNVRSKSQIAAVTETFFTAMDACKACYWFYHNETFLQVTFSEKRTKITPQTHIWKFEILHFSDNISKITMIQNFFCSEKCTISI